MINDARGESVCQFTPEAVNLKIGVKMKYFLN